MRKAADRSKFIWEKFNWYLVNFVKLHFDQRLDTMQLR